MALGFPVIHASTAFQREGYAALLGWAQVVDYAVVRDGIATERVWVVPDVPPQSRDANTPYLAFGIDPVLFDAPAFTEKDVDWTARSFLTFTPDCLMSAVVEPLCGFRWGYVIADGVVTPKELAPASEADWVEPYYVQLFDWHPWEAAQGESTITLAHAKAGLKSARPDLAGQNEATGAAGPHLALQGRAATRSVDGRDRYDFGRRPGGVLLTSQSG
jgi:hypothetical protein